MSAPQLTWSGREIQLATAMSSHELMSSVATLNLQNKDFELHTYRGFTSMSALDRTDNDYSIMACLAILPPLSISSATNRPTAERELNSWGQSSEPRGGVGEL